MRTESASVGAHRWAETHGKDAPVTVACSTALASSATLSSSPPGVPCVPGATSSNPGGGGGGGGDAESLASGQVSGCESLTQHEGPRECCPPWRGASDAAAAVSESIAAFEGGSQCLRRGGRSESALSRSLSLSNEDVVVPPRGREPQAAAAHVWRQDEAGSADQPAAARRARHEERPGGGARVAGGHEAVRGLEALHASPNPLTAALCSELRPLHASPTRSRPRSPSRRCALTHTRLACDYDPATVSEPRRASRRCCLHRTS